MKKTMENTTTTISRSCKYLRYYEVNGKELECICIYKDGEIILRTRSGWLEAVNANFEHKYLGDLLDITFDGEIKRANKINLNRKDNFFIKVPEYSCIHNGNTLFIHADNFLKSYDELPKKYLGKKASTEEGRKSYLYGYKVELKYPSTIYEMYLKHYSIDEKIEEEDVGKEFGNPILLDENGKYVTDADGNILKDKTKKYCSRYKKSELTECILYNGLYITEGK